MVCKNCGKELVKVGELTDKEYEDCSYVNNLLHTSNQALDRETIKGMEFEDGQVFEYFRAAFEARAKAEFLNYIFWRDLGKRLGIADNVEMILGDEPDSKDVYIHPQE